MDKTTPLHQGSRPQGPRPQAPRQQGPRRPGDRNPQKEAYAVNERIKAREVRLVGDNVENGVYSIHEALRIAEDLELDLIEIDRKSVV